MFNYFHDNKLRYEKGQLAPFFILIIVIFIIMAFFTINLSKVSLIKNDTGNAADAGALAGGSTMANFFNQQAVANSYLEANYRNFVTSEEALGAAIIATALVAAAKCASWPPKPPDDECWPSPPCIASAKAVKTGFQGAWLALLFYHGAQLFSYMAMRKQSKDGRDNAIKMAYSFAFLNSGIGSKIISGQAPEDTSLRRGDEFNYSDAFNDFLSKRLSAASYLDYKWTDGQDRKHIVRVMPNTENVNTYDLQYTVAPTITLIYWLIKVGYGLATSLQAACGYCPCNGGTAYGIAAKIAGVVAVFLGGILPGWVFRDSLGTNLLFPICWIDDIVHDRRFSVDTWQAHQGKDYGLWESKYPAKWDPNATSTPTQAERIESYGIVNFEGYGKIYPPEPNFDADLIKTDASNSNIRPQQGEDTNE